MGIAARSNPRSLDGKFGSAKNTAERLQAEERARRVAIQREETVGRIMQHFTSYAQYVAWCEEQKIGPVMREYLDARLPAWLIAEREAAQKCDHCGELWRIKNERCAGHGNDEAE